MASRLSRGCLRCRTRKVKCDEGRPSCQRCITRNELCTGYRDEGSLIFRYENQKVARKNVRRRASTPSLTECGTSSQWSETSGNSRSSKEIPLVRDPTNLSTVEISSLNLSTPFPWAKSIPNASLPSVEDQAVFRFFEKFVMYPGNQGSSPGFLEHLPCLFNEVKVEGRLALRWAVRAVAYASLSSEQRNLALGNKALQCYGLALSALADSLADPREAPDDYTLMTVVILDLFEGVYLQDSVAIGSHAEGMAQILRLRGPKQIYSARGWSLFRLSHHRLQKQQLAFHKSPLPDSEEWLNSLNEELPYVRAEKDNFQISKICEKARNLRQNINNSDLSVTETLKLVKEMHTLDKVATTWREGSEWAFKTIRRSEIAGVDETSDFPEFIQLHRDIWLAYEWNYHRTARTILHEHLLLCLDRLQNLCSAFLGNQEVLNMELCSLKQASITIIQTLTDEVLSTVPQSLGDVDHDGNIIRKTSKATKCQGIGGYFLLWSIKVAKSTRSATAQQQAAAQKTFERIRDCTGMRSALGEASNI